MNDRSENFDDTAVSNSHIEGKARPAVQASSTYKVLGEFDDPDGAGVLGRNTAASGTPIGVEGAVPNAGGGYGLSTPDDARVEGRVEAGGVHTPSVNTAVQARAEVTGGSGTSGDPFVLPTTVLDGYWGPLTFTRGWYEVDGLATDPAVDTDSRATWIRGDGIRSTTLQHASDAPDTPTIRFQDDDPNGNFGGVTDMTVYGAGEGDESGTANIVESDGNIIDLEFRNVIVRYGGGDGIRVEASGSGTRILNCWIEQFGGAGINLVGGTRAKVDNVHIVGGQAMEWGGRYGNISNVTVNSTDGENAIRVTSAGNHLNTVVIRNNVANALRINSPRNSADQFYVENLDNSGVYVTADDNTFVDVRGRNWGSDFGMLTRILSNRNRLMGIWGLGSDAGFDTRLATIDGDGNHVDGIGGVAGVNWEIEVVGGVENVIDDTVNVAWSNISDGGTRTLVNRVGTNAGDPNATGQWNGHADYAGSMDATVWDTTTTPWTPYRAQPDGGAWVAL